MINDSSSFVSAWLRGEVCMHMTDTLPGLSFNPENLKAMGQVLKIKGYQSQRPFVSLLESLELARKFWQPLPGTAEAILSKFWPGPLTLSWKASELAPKSLLSEDGYLAIRVPDLGLNNSLTKDVLKELKKPFPTTSVNERGCDPITTWSSALEFGKKFECIYLPDESVDNKFLQSSGLPSSLVRVCESGNLSLIRRGALSGPIEHFIQNNLR